MKKILHQIVIKSNTSNQYKTTITLLSLADVAFYVIVKTEHNGVVNEFEERCRNYKDALHQFLDETTEYASHTALMNL